MRCPFCQHTTDRVVDSREGRGGNVIRRRRECLGCGRRFTTYEHIDELPYMVVKKGGRHERFDRNKLLSGLLKACEKRPISRVQLEALADRVEKFVEEDPEHERSTAEVGAIVMAELKKLDAVSYLRFASVYLEFDHVDQFVNEVNELLERKQKPKEESL